MNAPSRLPLPHSASLRAVVFDLDGTLYDPRPLKRRMIVKLLSRMALAPWDVGTLRVLSTFRKLREVLAEEEVEDVGVEQYRRVARQLGVSEERVERTVRRWMLEAPLPHLAGCRFDGVREVFSALAAAGRQVAVYSDYPVDEKLAALGLTADVTVSAEEPGVGRLKPHPAGLEETMRRLGVGPRECVMVGDRLDRDAACAARAGVSWLLKVAQQSEDSATFSDYRELLPRLLDDP